MSGITTKEKNWQLFRIIAPVFPNWNIFSGYANEMTALGPVMVATAASKLWGWRAEIIDENNFNGKRNGDDLPDHQTLQKEAPATAVGFYCGLSSTIERVWQIAKFYHQQGIITIAGGWHAHYCPEEMLRNNINIVVHGDGEGAIQQILQAIASGESINNIPGISFLEDGQVKTNEPEMLEIPCLNNLPFPDFGLLKHAYKIKVYPVGRIRGCRMNCEFCSVKGEPRWASAHHLFETVNWLVDTRDARKFFIVDDRLEGDSQGTMEFFQLIANKYGKRLRFIVQIRLEAAKNTELLKIMRKAGVHVECIGYESPIDEDLKVMKKGYLSSDMLKWTKIHASYGFRIHGMFIFGYPPKDKKSQISVTERAKRFKTFIKKAHFFTIQIMHPVPIVGTELRKRLEDERRLFSQELVPWSRYDGNYACFLPYDMTLQELQEVPTELMRWFYGLTSLFRIPLRIITFPIDYLTLGWERWYYHWYCDVIKYGGHLLIQRWLKRQRKDNFLENLEKKLALSDQNKDLK